MHYRKKCRFFSLFEMRLSTRIFVLPLLATWCDFKGFTVRTATTRKYCYGVDQVVFSLLVTYYFYGDWYMPACRIQQLEQAATIILESFCAACNQGCMLFFFNKFIGAVQYV